MMGYNNNNAGNNTSVVRTGTVSVKEDGTFASWIWKVKYLVLKDHTLSFHKYEVRICLSVGITTGISSITVLGSWPASCRYPR